MASWKKVIVSGSSANLAALQVDNLTSGQVVIGGGASNLSTTAINGTGNIVATTAATGVSMSGSFSGSFQGSGANITGIVTASYALTASYAANVPSTSSYALQAATASFVTASGVFGPYGANSVVSASYAVTSSYALTSSYAVSASNTVSASFATTALTSSFIANAVTNNVNNYVLTATGGGSINGEQNLTFDGTLLTVTGNATITGDLSVLGTTTTINTDNLLIEDKFALFASGSSTATDGGIVVQATSGSGTATGFAWGYKATEDRWAFQDALAYNATAFGTVTAWSTTTQYGLASAKPNDATGPAYGGATYGFGNIWVSTDTADIWIYA